MGGLAPLESKEIAGIAVAFSIIATILLIVALVFIIRHRSCITLSHSATNPALSTIWVRKNEGSNGTTVVGLNGNNNNERSNGMPVDGSYSTAITAKDGLNLYDRAPTDQELGLNSNGQIHTLKVCVRVLWW